MVTPAPEPPAHPREPLAKMLGELARQGGLGAGLASLFNLLFEASHDRTAAWWCAASGVVAILVRMTAGAEKSWIVTQNTAWGT